MTEESGYTPFEPVEHTADIAFIARGRTLPELFENAAVGMCELLYEEGADAGGRELGDASRPGGSEARVAAGAGGSKNRVEVEAGDLEALLVAWLQEILYLLEVHRRACRAFRVECVLPPRDDLPARLVAAALGVPWDPARLPLRHEVKAVTYHGLEIEREPSSAGEVYRVRIVLDI
jgi:SHS2 domain-containing protein